ncbi:hypothetical protein [Shewanella frigidimarina]|jgi:hypothetical protein|uniref:hypothetical protein n=1 Tax=Shewanella frigidimarina TaxID=56812 RepID=UPI000F4EA77D|nr:hypothetical protein [Shewanella frigidimarina]
MQLLLLLTLQSCMQINFDKVEKKFIDGKILFQKISTVGCAIQAEVNSNVNYNVGDVTRKDSFITTLNSGVSNKDFFDITSQNLDNDTFLMFKSLDEYLIKLDFKRVLLRDKNKCMIFVPYGDSKDEVYYVYNPSAEIINNFIKPNYNHTSKKLSLDWYYYVEK